MCLVEFRRDNSSLWACSKWCSERSNTLQWIIRSRRLRRSRGSSLSSSLDQSKACASVTCSYSSHTAAPKIEFLHHPAYTGSGLAPPSDDYHLVRFMAHFTAARPSITWKSSKTGVVESFCLQTGRVLSSSCNRTIGTKVNESNKKWWNVPGRLMVV